MTFLDTHLAIGILALLGASGIAYTGWAPGTSTTETVPVSVRTNPASYRPIYTGYHYYARTSTSSGGGYRTGK